MKEQGTLGHENHRWRNIQDRNRDLQMAVKMNDADRSVRSDNASQEWQGNRMIATESDDSWQRLPFQGWAFHLGIRGRLTTQEQTVTLFNLLDCVGVVVASRSSAPITTASSGLKAYEVTGISPQSNTVAQLLNGFAARGTL